MPSGPPSSPSLPPSPPSSPSSLGSPSLTNITTPSLSSLTNVTPLPPPDSSKKTQTVRSRSKLLQSDSQKFLDQLKLEDSQRPRSKSPPSNTNNVNTQNRFRWCYKKNKRTK